MKYLSLFFLIFLLFSSCEKDDPGNNPPDKKEDPYNYKLGAGSSANDFLSGKKYSVLLVEIQYMEGFRPTDDAISALKNFLQARLNKNEISIRENKISTGGKGNYSVEDIRNIEDKNRVLFPSGDTLTAYFLFLDGDYVENSGNSVTLGIAYRNTSMAIFEKTIRDYTNDPISEPPTYKVETAVINHEFGHILGLVDIGTPMQQDHKDEAHGGHCEVQSCLMFWAVETGNIIDNLFGSPVPELDAKCIADLKANGGK